VEEVNVKGESCTIQYTQMKFAMSEKLSSLGLLQGIRERTIRSELSGSTRTSLPIEEKTAWG